MILLPPLVRLPLVCFAYWPMLGLNLSHMYVASHFSDYPRDVFARFDQLDILYPESAEKFPVFSVQTDHHITVADQSKEKNDCPNGNSFFKVNVRKLIENK